MEDSKMKIKTGEHRLPYARTSASPSRANTNVDDNYNYYIPIPLEDDSPVEKLSIKCPAGKTKRLKKTKSKGKKIPKKIWPYPLPRRCDMVAAKVMSQAASSFESSTYDNNRRVFVERPYLYKDIDYDPRFDDDLWNVGETNIVSVSRPGSFYIQLNATFNYVRLDGSLLVSSSSASSISSLNNKHSCSRQLSTSKRAMSSGSESRDSRRNRHKRICNACLYVSSSSASSISCLNNHSCCSRRLSTLKRAMYSGSESRDSRRNHRKRICNACLYVSSSSASSISSLNNHSCCSRQLSTSKRAMSSGSQSRDSRNNRRKRYRPTLSTESSF